MLLIKLFENTGKYFWNKEWFSELAILYISYNIYHTTVKGNTPSVSVTHTEENRHKNKRVSKDNKELVCKGNASEQAKISRKNNLNEIVNKERH